MIHFVAWLALAVLPLAHTQDPVVVTVPVGEQWIDTGIDLHKGDSLSVILRVPRANARAKPTLTGRIGEVTFGVSAQCTAPATGRLFLQATSSAESSGAEPESVRARISYVSRAGSTPGAAATPTPSQNKFVPLPNLVGMRFQAAVRTLKKYGLTPQREKRSSSYRAGEVVDQSPAAGTNTRRVRTVVLGVSDGSLSQVGTMPVKTAPPPVRTAPPPVETPRPPRRTAAPVKTAPPPRRTAPPPVRTAPPPVKTTAPTAAPRQTATARAVAVAPATPKRIKPAPSLAPAPATSPVTIAVPPVIGSGQHDAAATIERAGLRAKYLGEEQSSLPAGSVTRTEPAAGTPLRRGALVGYWVAGVPVRSGRGNGWVWWLFAAAAMLGAALVSVSLNNRMRLAKATRSLLTVHPSLELDGPTSFAGDVTNVTMEGPTTHITASVEMGEASFEGNGAISTREEHDD